MQFTAEQISAFLAGEVEGNPQATVWMVAKIEEAAQGELAFLSNPKYEEYLYTTDASIVLVSKSLELKKEVKSTLIRVDDPYQAFASLLNLYQSSKPRKSGVSPQAFIAATAYVEDDVYVGEFAVIGENVRIGEGSQIYPQVYVGDNVVIGENTKIFAGVKIYEDCVIGDNVTIHSGTVVGGDGFGFAPMADGTFKKIPQIGNVVIEDEVEIGANCTIDRATMGSTVIKRGAKLDNLIQIAHNVVIGENTVMAAQCGVAGSTKVGRNVMMGGQVGIVGHIQIADSVKIGSQSGIGHSVEKQGEFMLGSPAMTGFQNHRVQAILKELPELRKTILQSARQLKQMSDKK